MVGIELVCLVVCI